MTITNDENFLDLISETKKYLSQLNPNENITLEENEKAFFQDDINKMSSKLRGKSPPPPPSQPPVQRNTFNRSTTTNNMNIKRNVPLQRPQSHTPNAKKPSPQIKQVPKDKNEKPAVPEKFITLEKPKTIEHNYNEIKKVINDTYPKYRLFEAIPTDKKAKQIANSWKLKKHATDITILVSKETPQQKLFLRNLTAAINTICLPSKIISAIDIEKENQWNVFLSQEDLKLVIACDCSIWSLPNLMKHHKEEPTTHVHFLKDIPLFLLPDISLYLKDPLLKKSLWASLLEKIDFLKTK